MWRVWVVSFYDEKIYTRIRIWNLTYEYSWTTMLPSVKTQYAPVICKCSLIFLNRCLVSDYAAVSFLALHGVFTARRVCIPRTMPWQDVRPSVRLSHAGIVSKRLHKSSEFFHRQVAPPSLFFSVPNGMAIFRREPPERGPRMQGGK